MAEKTKGITITLDADATGVKKAFKDLTADSKTVERQLQEIKRALKFDPGNTALLEQQQKLLAEACEKTKTQLEGARQAQQAFVEAGGDLNSETYTQLVIETEKLTDHLRYLEQQADQSVTALEKIGDTADKVAAGASKVAGATKGMSLAAGGALSGIAGMAYKAVTASDDLNTLAKQSGFSTGQLQKMQYAADRIDVSMEDITSSAQKLKKNMSGSSKDVQAAFDLLGVSIRDSSGEMRDINTVYWETVDALSRVQNETERDQLAMTLMGKSADSLAGIIDDGGKAFRELGKEAEDAGLIMSQETLDSLNAVNDQVDSLKAKASATLSQSGAKALEAAMPLLERLVEVLDWLLTSLGKLTPAQMGVLMTILAIVAAISPLASAVSGIAKGVSFVTTTVIPALATAASFVSGTVLPALSSAFSAIAGAIAPVVTAIGSFIAAHALIIGAVVAVVAGIALFGDQIQAILGRVDSYLQGVFAKDWTEVFGPVLGGILNDFLQKVKDFWDAFKLILDGVIDIIRGVFTGNWKRVWQGVVEVFRGVFDSIKAVAKAPINAVISLINSAIGKINWFISKANTVAGVFGKQIGTIGQIPLLAKGGILSRGSAFVGEAGPELLTVAGGKAIVQPLTPTANTGSPKSAIPGAGGGTTTVNIAFTGSLAQLGKVLRPVIVDEASRVGSSLIIY